MEDDVFRFIYYSKKHSLNNCQIRSSGCSHNYQKSAMEKINNDFAKKKSSYVAWLVNFLF